MEMSSRSSIIGMNARWNEANLNIVRTTGGFFTFRRNTVQTFFFHVFNVFGHFGVFRFSGGCIIFGKFRAIVRIVNNQNRTIPTKEINGKDGRNFFFRKTCRLCACVTANWHSRRCSGCWACSGYVLDILWRCWWNCCGCATSFASRFTITWWLRRNSGYIPITRFIQLYQATDLKKKKKIIWL